MASHDVVELDRDRRELLRTLQVLTEAARAALPGERTPCFAHMRLRSRGRARDYLLGWKTLVSPELALLHWQTAPLATVFFAHEEGGEYELEIEGRTLHGEVLARNLLELDEGGHLRAVVRVSTGEKLVRGSDGDFVRKRGGAPASLLPPRPPAVRAKVSSPVDVPLDEAQLRAVRHPPGDALLVLGEAGAGKTTVALHRLAHLRRARGDRPFRAVVVVPTEGLRRLSESLLARLGLEGSTDVLMYDRLAARLAHRAFRGLPVRESEGALPGVIRLKRHRALEVALAARARATPRNKTGREDLLELFGDRALLSRVAEASGGAVAPRDVEATALHTRAQFRETAEQEFAHVTDAERLEAVDARGLDALTPAEDAGTIDAEDYAALFELDRLRARARGERDPSIVKPFDCVVVDEAQELAPLELRLVGRALAHDGTLVVAGDAGQQVDATACFTDWSTSMHDLGAGPGRHAIATLETSYRCPPAVTALARAVLDPARVPAAREALSATTPQVSLLRTENECHLLAYLVDALRSLRGSDGGASAAVIARTPAAAKRMAGLLARGGLEVRLALDGDFHFGPGVHVTCVQEVKGLEFDHVLVPDAGPSAYPAEPEARRALYVAATRASQHLLLATVARWSPVLSPLVEG